MGTSPCCHSWKTLLQPSIHTQQGDANGLGVNPGIELSSPTTLICRAASLAKRSPAPRRGPSRRYVVSVQRGRPRRCSGPRRLPPHRRPPLVEPAARQPGHDDPLPSSQALGDAVGLVSPAVSAWLTALVT
jgi:hypothetical protein